MGKPHARARPRRAKPPVAAPDPVEAGDPVEPLRAARAALAAGDARQALCLVLDAWRAVPDPLLGPLAEQIGLRAVHDVHVPMAVDRESRDAQWLELAASGDPVIRHHLIATVREYEREHRLPRLQALIRTRDPRLSPVVRQTLLDETPDYWVTEYWLPLFAMLGELGDPAVLEMLDAIEPARGRVKPATTKRIAKVRAKLALQFPSPPTLSEEARAIVESFAPLLEATKPPRDHATEQQLLAAIYADPASDGPRAVYADWLQELGDPRGEYIALALSFAGKSHEEMDWAAVERAGTLEALNSETWLGPLAGVAHFDWRRGFPREASFVPPLVDVPVSAAWSTLERVQQGFPGHPSHPMPVLRSALDLDLPDFERLAAMPVLPALERIGFRTYARDLDDAGFRARYDGAARGFARALPNLPALRELVVVEHHAQHRSPTTDPWPWKGTQLKSVAMAAHVDELGAWLLHALDSQLDSFTVQTEYTYGWNVTLARDEHGRFSKLDVWNSVFYVSNDLETTFPTVIAALLQLPADSLSQVRFAVLAKAWSLPRRKLFQTFLARQTKVTALVSGYTPPKR